jgi:putative cardiolipin synthase
MPTQLSQVLIDNMEGANEELILVSAYLIPTPELEQAIENAEDRGVRVRILTNSLRSNNHVAAHSAYRHHVRRLLDHGAEVHEVRVYAKDRALYMEDPVGDKHLGLHSKLLLIDNHLSYIGSANLDPRSLNLNTEMGLLIKSSEFNKLVREVVALDFHQRNAWHLQAHEDGSLRWVADDTVLDKQPAESTLQRLEDWFLSILPIEDEM